MKKFIASAIIAFCCQLLLAQDPHFSQYNAAPLYVNPALTGVFEGQLRLGAIYRDQWASITQGTPFRTFGLAADYRYNIAHNDYLSAGLQLLHDEAGSARFLQSKGYFSLAYSKQLSEGGYRSGFTQYLTAGAQLGFAQNRISWNHLTFSEQFNNNTQTYDPNLSSNETFGGNQHSYLDFNAGLLWYALFGDNANVYVGGSLAHINRPTFSFYDNSSETLYARWTFHAGGEIGLSENLSVLPNLVVMGQGPSLESNFGASLRFLAYDWNDTAVRLGAWGRLTNDIEKTTNLDALILAAMFELHQWSLGLSYDVNMSKLNTATNTRGAFEISLQYIIPERYRGKALPCPKF
jgi:type IX secretion system PorP/SprF family membrane protein